jgi:hypothetical protein
MKNFLKLGLLNALILSIGCNDDAEKISGNQVKFMVISDVHYFDPSLFTIPVNTFLGDYLKSDRKLILESNAILNKTFEIIKEEKPDFLLIPGDLTKDGEKISHQNLAVKFEQLTNEGIKVLVIPGNHDINNSNAYSFMTGKIKVESISERDFSMIYNGFGYGKAIERDDVSLSYMSEPVDGLWVLGIDACLYKTFSETKGSISAETMNWIKTIIQKAAAQNKILIAFMHHGLYEHFQGQGTFFPEFLLTNWNSTAETLANLGLKVVFTGHFHAQDVVKYKSSSGFIFDIETGSTVTYPCPYRTINLDMKSGQMSLIKGYITNVSFSTIPQGTDFQAYAKSFLNENLNTTITKKLNSPPWSIPSNLIKSTGLDRVFTNAFFAHTTGDEMPLPADYSDIQLVKSLSPVLGEALHNVWNDPEPADNDITIDLKTGNVVKN